MLLENFAEVAEPYHYEFVNSNTGLRETLTRANDISLGNTLQLHLEGYIRQQFADAKDDDEIVAEDEPPENCTDPCANLTETGSFTTAPNLGKSKKDKEKALRNGELHDHLWL